LTLIGLIIGLPTVFEYLDHGLVRIPTATLAATFMLLAALSLVVGLVLQGVLRARKEAARLAYLQWDPPPTTTALSSQGAIFEAVPEDVVIVSGS
jgi:hypothetical protein